MTADHILGLSVVPNFVTSFEADALIAVLDDAIWLTDLKRRVQHYGWRYDYRTHALDTSHYLGALPDWADRLARRLHDEGHTTTLPDQVIVNEYHPGQGIAPHVDCVPCFNGTILSLSLGGACVMTFDSLPSAPSHEAHHDLWLQPADLLIMTGEARYQWKHGIPARKSDEINGIRIARSRRISLTFRTVLRA